MKKEYVRYSACCGAYWAYRLSFDIVEHNSFAGRERIRKCNENQDAAKRSQPANELDEYDLQDFLRVGFSILPEIIAQDQKRFI